MANIRLRERARALRQEGESIRNIAQILKISKSTVSYWCRDIALAEKQIALLANRQRDGALRGRLQAAEMKRAARIATAQAEHERGRRSVGSLGRRDILMLGMALYWGEGYKAGNEECGLTNSNPDIIRTFIIWLRQIYDVSSSELILRVSINSVHKQRIQTVERYWSRMTNIPISQFTKASLIHAKSRKVYSNRDDHFGTLRVKVRKATSLRRRILGSIAEIARQIHSM